MLEEKRLKIRLIQQRKISEKELIDLNDLPQEIPLTLSIGHRVYTHICHPEEGVFLGTIAAVDPVEHTYRVVFDRSSIGSHTVHDYEIKSVSPIQTIPIKAYIQTYRPKVNQPNQSFNISPKTTITPNSTIINLSGYSNCGGVNNLLMDDLNTLNASNPAFALMIQSSLDPVQSVGYTTCKQGNESLQDLNSRFQSQTGACTSNGKLGGFPIHFLLMITRLNKILNAKKEFILKLNELNTEAERIKANDQEYSREFRATYASLVSDLGKLNNDLNDYSTGVQRFCEQFSSEFKFNSSLAKTENFSARFSANEHVDLKKYYLNESVDLISKLNRNENETENNNKAHIEDNMNKINLNENSLSNQSDVESLSLKFKSKHISELVIKLTSLMLQIKDFVNSTSKNMNLNLSDNKHKDDSSGSSQNSEQHSPTPSEQHSPTPAPSLPLCTKTLNDSINEIKKGLKSSSNAELFEDKIQVHINHIQSVLCHYNKLHSFKYALETQLDHE